jgi:uncharacterized protein
MFLPDINVWLAMAFEGHAHHAKAKDWFERVPDNGSAFCRFTQQGLLRLATNPQALGQQAVSLLQAWQIYDALLADPRVGFVREPASLEVYWRVYTRRRAFSHKVWSDAYLAAFARAADFELVSLDQGFKQYRNLKHAILS